MKGMGCPSVDEERRRDINRYYYNMGSLEEQRQWISRHVKSMEPKMAGADSRKTRSIEYYLPSDVSGDVVRVFRVTFLNTLMSPNGSYFGL